MSSIDNKGIIPTTHGVLPGAPGADAAAAPGAASPTDPLLAAALNGSGDLSAVALMGMSEGDLDRLLHGQPMPKHKLALVNHITSTPPPLPADRAPISTETQAQYASLASDISSAMASGTRVGTGGDKADMFRQLASMTDAEANTPEGAAKIQQIAEAGVGRALSNVATLSDAGMMAAFMVLQVQNKASGKELDSVLQDLTTEARNNQLEKHKNAMGEATKALEKAAKKQKLAAKLGPLFEAVIAIVTLVITIGTLGTGTGAALTLAAAAMGFLVGGAVGGASKGNGFDMGAAFSGLAIGGGVGAMAGKAIAMILEKVASTLAARSLATAGAQAGTKVAADASKASTLRKMADSLVGNASNKFTLGQSAALSGAGAAATVGKGVLDYQQTMANLRVQERQAEGKAAKVMAELLQNQWSGLMAALQSMQEMHTTAVNQVMSMLKTRNMAQQRAVANIAG